MVLPVFRYMADKPVTIVLSLLVCSLSCWQQNALTARCAQLAGTSVPDLHFFGFAVDELRDMYRAWGEEGCNAYYEAASIDLFPLMESYTLCLGSLLVLGARRQGIKDRISMIALAVMICDVGETFILRSGCRNPPEYLSSSMIKLSSLCNILKWILLSASLGILSLLFLLKGKNSPKILPARKAA
jgi:hypothetical protein